MTNKTPPKKSEWNYRPKGAVALSPLFSWPLNPRAIFIWFATYWGAISTMTIGLAVSLASYSWLLPPLEQIGELRPAAILRVWAAIAIPHCVCAGMLHHWLYRKKGQGLTYKYDPRWMTENSGVFTFRNQVHDNMFWTIVSGLTQCTAYQVLIFWAMAAGYAPFISLASNPIWFIAWFFILPIWSSFHFYWIHRLLHWPPLYRLAHSLHHRNINVGPWSGISMHPIEHILYFSTFLIHFIVPSHPIHVLFHATFQTVHPACSHSGFDQLWVKDKERMKLGSFFHHLHHRYFECNYGTVEMPWDRWFGSYHDGSDAATVKTRARKKQMYGQ